MSDLPDPSLWRLLEHIGPWVGNIGGAVAAVIAYVYRGLRNELDAMKKTLERIPETYETQASAGKMEDRIEAAMKTHMDAVREDVRMLQTDVREVLKMMVQRKD